jgi:predicted nucleotidyltransferase
MNNLLLYGSFARNDSNKDSDVDLLGISNDRYSRKIVKSNVNLTLYPYQILKKMASSGALFVYHLKEEGRILNDGNDLFTNLFLEIFVLKDSYCEEQYFSKQLLKKIIKLYPKLNNFKFANSKISWCIRTHFAAIGAESNTPIFSEDSIKKHFGEFEASLLSIKKSTSQITSQVDKAVKLIDSISKNIKEQPISEDLQKYEKRVLRFLQNDNYLELLDLCQEEYSIIRI